MAASTSPRTNLSPPPGLPSLFLFLLLLLVLFAASASGHLTFRPLHRALTEEKASPGAPSPSATPPGATSPGSTSPSPGAPSPGPGGLAGEGENCTLPGSSLKQIDCQPGLYCEPSLLSNQSSDAGGLLGSFLGLDDGQPGWNLDGLLTGTCRQLVPSSNYTGFGTAGLGENCTKWGRIPPIMCQAGLHCADGSLGLADVAGVFLGSEVNGTCQAVGNSTGALGQLCRVGGNAQPVPCQAGLYCVTLAGLASGFVSEILQSGVVSGVSLAGTGSGAGTATRDEVGQWGGGDWGSGNPDVSSIGVCLSPGQRGQPCFVTNTTSSSNASTGSNATGNSSQGGTDCDPPSFGFWNPAQQWSLPCADGLTCYAFDPTPGSFFNLSLPPNSSSSSAQSKHEHGGMWGHEDHWNSGGMVAGFCFNATEIPSANATSTPGTVGSGCSANASANSTSGSTPRCSSGLTCVLPTSNSTSPTTNASGVCTNATAFLAALNVQGSSPDSSSSTSPIQSPATSSMPSPPNGQALAATLSTALAFGVLLLHLLAL